MRVAKIYSDALIPTRKNPTDAGLDLYLLVPFGEDVITLYPDSVNILHTGITVEIPKGTFGWITNKSRNNFLIGGGIIDEGYQGELLVKVINPTDKNIILYHGNAIAQLLIIPIIIPDVEYVLLDDIHQNSTSRGNDGGIVRQGTNVL
jgi:dUTP pyrophosphatase